MKNILRKSYGIVSILFLLGTSHSFGQLTLSPSSIEFKDNFHRLQNIYFINAGADTIQVDSIYYNSEVNYNANLYLTRFNTVSGFPFKINPGDSVLMDCILAGYQAVSPLDTNDIMWVATKAAPARPLNIKIDFFNYEYGKISGTVMDGSSPVGGVIISFFFNGKFLYRQIGTQPDGTFSVSLPTADYTIGVENAGYYTTFYNNKSDALSASTIHLGYNDSINLNFRLTKIGSVDTAVSITGKILDYSSKAPIKRGIVIVRRGKHNPSKILAGTSIETYSTIIKPDGTYKIEGITPGSYYLQSFSSYYAPSYYSFAKPFEYFWYNADSLFINKGLNNIDFQMPRDSSFWGGIIGGNIISDLASFQYTDIIVYAISENLLQDTLINSYSTVANTGKFSIQGLPVGTYRLIAQKIGYANSVSEGTYTITENKTVVQNAAIYYTDGNNTIPTTSFLYQNYPNPFNPTTTIRLYLKQGENVLLRVINVLGQEVTTLQNGFMPTGFHSFIFKGNNLSSGIYFISLITGSQQQVKKMVLLK